MNTTTHTPKSLLPSDDRLAYRRWVYRQKAYDRWQPFVDADTVRAHLLHVMATSDTGWHRLADEAGVPRGTVGYLLYGRNGRRPDRVTAETGRRILALKAERRPGTTMPAIGTQRRIQVLAGEGWPQVRLGPQFGIHSNYVNALLKAERVLATTAAAVADAYQRLNGVDPLTCGVPAAGIRAAKRVASAEGWPDRLFWDDVDRIDDPDFDPKTVLDDAPRYVELGENALWLMGQGFTRKQVGERLGVHPDYIDASIKRYRKTLPKQQVEVAA